MQFVHFGKNDLFIRNRHHIFFSLVCFARGYLPFGIQLSLSQIFWPLNIFFVFSLLTLPFMMIENDKSSGLDMNGNKYDNGHNKGGNEHLTTPIT